MEYRYWDWGQTTKRDDYQFAVLHLALGKTTPQFGPYQLTRVLRNYSTLRMRRELHLGEAINVNAGPWRPPGQDGPLERSIAVDVPILNGLLGLRSLLIRSEDLDKFRRIDSPAALKALNAGQGRNWVEVDMYRRAGYSVVDSGHVSTLVPMLANQRFDYLPLSVIEIDSVLASYPQYAGRLMAAPGILLTYPLPVVFHVSPRHPELARRLHRGLNMARRDGSLDALLLRFFSDELAAARRVRHVFKVPNPAPPADMLRDPLATPR
jgi:hypothetical protein